MKKEVEKDDEAKVFLEANKKKRGTSLIGANMREGENAK